VRLARAVWNLDRWDASDDHTYLGPEQVDLLSHRFHHAFQLLLDALTYRILSALLLPSSSVDLSSLTLDPSDLLSTALASAGLSEKERRRREGIRREMEG
jgi:hypothetical protein